MRQALFRRMCAFLVSQLVLIAPPAIAQDAESRANEAVSEPLFEEDAEAFTSFRVNERGFVDISFASDTPDAVYVRIVQKLESHPDVDGVLAGKGGPACRRF